MVLIDDVLEKVSLEELLTRVKTLENRLAVLEHNFREVINREVVEDMSDTRAS